MNQIKPTEAEMKMAEELAVWIFGGHKWREEMLNITKQKYLEHFALALCAAEVRGAEKIISVIEQNYEKEIRDILLLSNSALDEIKEGK